MRGIRDMRTRSEFPSQYPSDINPKNAPIIILVITGLEPTQNDNWRKITNSNDKLIKPLKNINAISHARIFLDMIKSPIS